MKIKWWHVGLIVSLLMAGVISHFASPYPDGLERVAEDRGFLEKGERQEAMKSPMPNYVVPGIPNEKLAASLAGLIGTLMMFVLVVIIGKALSKNETRLHR